MMPMMQRFELSRTILWGPRTSCPKYPIMLKTVISLSLHIIRFGYQSLHPLQYRIKVLHKWSFRPSSYIGAFMGQTKYIYQRKLRRNRHHILTTTTRQAADLWRSLVGVEVAIFLLCVVFLLVVWLGQ